MPTQPRRCLRRWCAAGAALLLVGACARAPHGGTPAPARGAHEPFGEPVPVTVVNHGWTDVRVRVAYGARSQRIGTVTATSTAKFRIPATAFIGPGVQLQLVADPVGGRQAVRSEFFTLSPGSEVEWTLESSLTRSSLAVR